ncbi:MAG TPA: ABC transporter permease [Acidimicrobiales bacterium]|nr:ABC transporter permease [Acidimicrobiales bacterium]
MAIDVGINRHEHELEEELAGLDALEEVLGRRPSRLAQLWSSLWPKLAAAVIALTIWQVAVWSNWRPEYVFPGPATVLSDLWHLLATGEFWRAVGVTMRRAVTGYALAVLIGSAIGLAVARVRPLRTAVGSLITGLQTMPSIAWFPLAILFFQLSEQAILFVVVLGAAPSIANGLISGVDHVPPLLLRSGRMLGARGLTLYRHVILPASLPAFVAGLKQGWAFAWRSLMAGELLVNLAGKPSLGANLIFARDVSDAPGLMAIMIVILVIGILVDGLFERADRAIRSRWGLIDAAA